MGGDPEAGASTVWVPPPDSPTATRVNTSVINDMVAVEIGQGNLNDDRQDLPIPSCGAKVNSPTTPVLSGFDSSGSLRPRARQCAPGSGGTTLRGDMYL